MASFSSALAVFILALFSGCFTLPLDNWNLHDPNTVGLKFIPTTETNEHMGLDVSTPFFSLLDNDKRDYIDTVSTPVDELSTPMIGHQVHEKKDLEDPFSTPVDELSTPMIGHQVHKKKDLEDELSTPVNELSTPVDELSTPMTEQKENGKQDFDGSFSTTVKPTTTDMSEEEEEEDNDKREIRTEFTTNNSFLSESISSKVSTPQSLTSSSKGKKYAGLLPNDNEKQEGYVSEEGQDLEPEVEPTKPTTYTKFSQESKTKPELESSDSFPSENRVEQNSTEIIPRLALYDQSALDNISPNLGGVMTLDDNSTMIVTDSSTVLSTSANKIEKSDVSLNQGEKSLHDEKKESNN